MVENLQKRHGIILSLDKPKAVSLFKFITQHRWDKS